jgi:hypothetical protein
LVPIDPEVARQEAVTPQGQRGLRVAGVSRRVTNQTHRSRTDAEATLAKKQGTPRQLKYKVHQSIDADSRVIWESEVTTGARHENLPYLNQLTRITAGYQLTIHEAIADRGSGSAAIIRTLQARGITPYIPLWNGQAGTGTYASPALVYDIVHDRFRCPQGKYLTPNPAVSANRKRYVSQAADCQACPQTATCPAQTRKSSAHQRFIQRNLDADLFAHVLAQMRTPVFKQKAAERMWKMEGMFAEAKQYHRLSRARYRGHAKVQIQAYLSAIAQNLKRLVTAGAWRRGRG